LPKELDVEVSSSNIVSQRYDLEGGVQFERSKSTDLRLEMADIFLAENELPVEVGLLDDV